MTQPQKYLRNWKLSLLFLALSFILNSCSSKEVKPSPAPEVIIKTKVIEKNIPIQERPKGLSLNKDISWLVITPNNIGTFEMKLEKEQGEEWVFYAISVKDYEKMSLNVAELRRYIIQQLSLIEYYENSIRDNQTRSN